MLATSQLAASAVTTFEETDSAGINPYAYPRLDEEDLLGEDAAGNLLLLSKFSTAGVEEMADIILPDGLLRTKTWAAGKEAYSLGSGQYAFWLVLNAYKDVSHKATLAEQESYRTFARPVRFLNATDKKTVTSTVTPVTKSIRKQLPVLLDFNSGRVYVESVNKNELMQLSVLLETLGAKTFGLAWSFETQGHWPSKFLTHIARETQYKHEFKKRAEETSRFRSDEIEKHENSEIEGIVKKFFAVTELDSGLQFGLGAPAQVRLHPTSSPIAGQVVTNVTTLFDLNSETEVTSSSVTVQERRSTLNKKSGEEKIFRVDLLSFDLNDGMNLTEVGAATLRGFDLPQFKKDLMKEIRKTKQVPPLDRFWRDWLREMANAVLMIETDIKDTLDATGPYGIQPMSSGSGSDEVIEESE